MSFRVALCDNTSKTLAEKLKLGVKQIGEVTSVDLGKLVIICTGINALENVVPHSYIFRSWFRHYMLHGASSGYSSDWITSEKF